MRYTPDFFQATKEEALKNLPKGYKDVSSSETFSEGYIKCKCGNVSMINAYNKDKKDFLTVGVCKKCAREWYSGRFDPALSSK